MLVVYFRIVHKSLLVGEAAWNDSVAGFLRAKSHRMELSLLGSHIAAISIECTHGGLSTAVQGRRSCRARVVVLSNLDSSFLGGRQFLDKTGCGAI